MQRLKEVQTSNASEKRSILEYDIMNSGQYKFVKQQKCESGHEKLRARTQSTSMFH